MKKFIAILLLCLGSLISKAQTFRYCPFDSAYEAGVNSDPEKVEQRKQMSLLLHDYNSTTPTVQSTTPLIVPIVVHVIHPNTQSVGQGINISYLQILSQIDRLNADCANDTIYTQLPSGYYAVNVGIQFCLATIPIGPSQWTDTLEPGVMRYGVSPSNTLALNQVLSPTYLTPVNTLVGLTHPANSGNFPFSNYLNIWTVNIITDSAGGNQYGGYATTGPNGPYPLDGIVMDAHLFGDATVNNNNFPILYPQYNTGNVLTHEVGHYLSLIHTFDGGCSGTTAATCQTSGDYICDTPPNTDQTFGCPSLNSCTENYFTQPPSLPSDHFDMGENYMTWHDDNCLNTFTNEQGMVMRNFLTIYRGSLVDPVNLSLTGVASPNGCIPSQLLAPILGPNLLCVNVSDTFSTLTGPGFTSVSWQWQFAGGTPSTSTLQNPIVTWNSTGTFLIILTAFDTQSNSVSDSVFITINPCNALASSQGIWYFGRKAGLDFASGVAVHDDQAEINNTLFSGEGCVSIGDTAGNLLFYSNGGSIWDKNHNLAIPNLIGDSSTSKTQIIVVPHPLHDNWYYLFHGPAYEDHYDPIRYSIVADSNNTIIPIVLNDTLPTPLGCDFAGEAITAIPHCNGRDTWVITRGADTSVSPVSIWQERLFIYLVSGAGVTNPSGAGQFPGIFQLNTGERTDYGCLKGAPDNQHIVVTHSAVAAASVLDFDNSTGVISNDRPVGNWGGSYGCSFSPNSQLIYFANAATGIIYQTDITAASLVATPVGTVSGFSPGSMQLGPDSLLYVSVFNTNYVSRFNAPDVPGSPNFSAQAVQLDPVFPLIATRYGLPNMIDGYVPAEAQLAFNITFVNCSTVVCNVPSCWGVPYHYAWNFGDATPIDTNANPTHVYTASGQYVVTLTISVGMFSYPVITQPIAVFLTAPVISGPTSTCATTFGFATYNVPSGAQSYQWSVTSGGSIVSADTLSTCNISWNSSGTVTCVVNNGAGCTFTSTLIVTVHPNPIADAGADTAYACPGGFLQIGGNPTASAGTAPYTYQWFPVNAFISSTVSNPYVTVTGPSTYTVNVTDNFGCFSSDIIFVDVDSSLTAPTITFSSLPQSCDNGPSINLALYVTPFNSNGVFSGNAVTGNLFDPANANVPDSNTFYYLYTDTTTGCASLDSSYIYVYNCCNVSSGINTTNGQTSSTYGIQFNAVPVPVRINGTFYIDNTFFISGYNGANIVRCAPNATIVVKAGAHLIIQANSVLRACDDMWNGIIVEPGGELHILTNSIVADAKQAIVSKNGAKFTLDRALLRDNYQNVIVEPYNGQGLHTGTIVRSRISGSVLTLAPYAGVKTFSGVEITGVDSIYIGTPTTVLDENVIRDMDFGVITTAANVYIRNNEFRGINSNSLIAVPACCAIGGCPPNTNCNPPPKGTAIWSQGNNVTIGGPNLTYQNRFRNCTRGILAEKSINTKIQNNDFQNINASSFLIPTFCIGVRQCKSNTEIITNNVMSGSKSGIVFSFSTQTTAIIEDNDINNLGGTGIQVTQTTECPVSIGFNTINATATANGKYGIRVGNAVITNSIPYVEIHGNITKKVEKHIWVTNFPYIVIDSSNNMQFQNGVPATAQFGIQVQNSHDALVDGNTVIKNGGVPLDTNYRKRLYGISMETNCYNTQVSNNGILKMGTGIHYFNASNFPSTISCNSMTNNMYGVHLNSTLVGNQGNGVSATFPNGIAQDNRWTIQNAQTTFYKAVYGSGTSPTGTVWYYRSSTGGYLPTPIQISPPLFVSFSGPLANAPSLCVQPCPTCLVQANLSSVAARNSPFDTMSYAPLFLSDQNVYAQLRANQTLLAMGTQYDTTLSRFYSQNQYDNVGYIDDAYLKASQGDTTGAALAKDGIIPRGDPDLNHKLVLEIYLRSWGRQQFYFVPQDSAILYAIATQNVLYGGTAVYDARVMLDLDIDDIGFGSALRLAVTEIDTVNKGVMYPNPTTESTTYYIELNDDESGYVVITDIFGRPVNQLPLNKGSNQVEISFAELPSGVYLYRSVINGALRETGKIVVDK